jgi:hypothetical protein
MRANRDLYGFLRTYRDPSFIGLVLGRREFEPTCELMEKASVCHQCYCYHSYYDSNYHYAAWAVLD